MYGQKGGVSKSDWLGGGATREQRGWMRRMDGSGSAWLLHVCCSALHAFLITGKLLRKKCKLCG